MPDPSDRDPSGSSPPRDGGSDPDSQTERTDWTGGSPASSLAEDERGEQDVDPADRVDGPERGPRTDPAAARRPAPEPGTRAASGSRPTGWPGFAYDVGTSILAVLLVGGFLFAVSGVWPPLVAVESGSMIPNMHQGDLVFVMEEHRFAGDGAVDETGVVTAASAASTEYRTFGGYGDVIVYAPDGNANRTPIIHRAMLWVEKGERWYDEADPDDVPGHVSSCAELRNCPAPHAGFITKGDNNGEYDQANGLSAPVRPEWVVGTAEIRLPGLGWIRLGTS